jgi:hypothetical protein
MAGIIGQYLEPLLLNAVFGGGAAQSAFTGNASVYIGVSTATSPANDAALKSGEPSATGAYARITVTNNATNFPAATGSAPSSKSMNVSFSFPVSTLAWSTGASALASFFIADASTNGAGNILWSGPLTPATDIVNGAGVTFSFAIGALTFTLN